MFEGEGEGRDHWDGYGDDEKVAADVEGCLHDGKMLKSCALRVGRRDGPISIERSTCGEEGDLNGDPSQYNPYCDESDPFGVCSSGNHTRKHEKHACFECPDDI